MKRFGDQEKALDKFVETDFEKRLLRASFLNLQDFTNELCFNSFACGIRELSRHILGRLGPDANIIRCCWYENEMGDRQGVTRAQRIKYAVQGGITDDFVINELDLDLRKLSKRVIKAIDMLSKYTHVDESTLGMSPKMIYVLVNEIVGSFEVLFKAIQICRVKIIKSIENRIEEVVLNHSIENTFDEIDILSTHSSIDECYVSYVAITNLTEQHVIISVSGTMAVRLQYGSDGDMRSGDGAISNDSFPFTCELTAEVNQLKEFVPEVDSLIVNTNSYYE